MNGVSLRVAILHDPPMDQIIHTANGSLEYSGLSGELFKAFREHLQFRSEYVVGSLYGSYVNGVSTGAVGMVHRDEVDIVASLFYYTPQRSQVVDYLYPFYTDRTALLMNQGNIVKRDNQLGFLSQPFSTSVWAAIFCSFFLASVALLAVIYCNNILIRTGRLSTSSRHQKYPYIEITESLCRILLQQGVGRYNNSIGTAGRWLLVSCWLLAIVLSASYVGQFVATFTVSKDFQFRVYTIKDLSESREVKPILVKGFSVADYLKGSDYGRKILTKVDECSGCEVTSSEDAVEQLLSSPDYAFVTHMQKSKHIIRSQFAKTDRCDLIMAPQIDVPSTYGSFIIPKNSKYRNILYNEMSFLVESGLVGKWMQRYFHKEGQCFTRSGFPRAKSVGSTNSLTLKATYGIFILWTLGIILSILLLLGECCFKKFITKPSA